MKKSLWILLIIIPIFIVATTSVVEAKHPKVIINGVEKAFEPAPFIQNDRTLVPMRAFFEALGADVTWDEKLRTAIGVRDGIVVEIPIGEDYAYVNNKKILLDVAGAIIDNRTFVPLRFVGEALGEYVFWHDGVIAIDKDAIKNIYEFKKFSKNYNDFTFQHLSFEINGDELIVIGERTSYMNVYTQMDIAVVSVEDEENIHINTIEEENFPYFRGRVPLNKLKEGHQYYIEFQNFMLKKEDGTVVDASHKYKNEDLYLHQVLGERYIKLRSKILTDENYLSYYKNNYFMLQLKDIGNHDDYIEKNIDEIIANKAREITSGLTSDYEKAKAINDWIAENMNKQDLEGINTSIKIEVQEFFYNKKGRSQEFANLTKAMLNAVKIPANVIVGNSSKMYSLTFGGQLVKSSGINSFVNTAYVDNRWIFMDVHSNTDNVYYNKNEYFDMSLGFLSNYYYIMGIPKGYFYDAEYIGMPLRYPN